MSLLLTIPAITPSPDNVRVLSNCTALREWYEQHARSFSAVRSNGSAGLILLGDDYRDFRLQMAEMPGNWRSCLCLTQPFADSYMELHGLGVRHYIYPGMGDAFEALRLAVICASMPGLTLTPYMEFSPEPHLDASKTYHVATRKDLDDAMAWTGEFLAEAGIADNTVCRQILLCQKEGVTNAVFHSFKNAQTGEQKYDAATFNGLSDGDTVRVTLAVANGTINLTVCDNGGSLGPLRVVNSLDRHHTNRGLMDMRGRGFFLMHQLAQRTVVNIQRQNATQVSMYFAPAEKPASGMHHFQIITND